MLHWAQIGVRGNIMKDKPKKAIKVTASEYASRLKILRGITRGFDTRDGFKATKPLTNAQKARISKAWNYYAPILEQPHYTIPLPKRKDAPKVLRALQNFSGYADPNAKVALVRAVIQGKKLEKVTLKTAKSRAKVGVFIDKNYNVTLKERKGYAATTKVTLPAIKPKRRKAETYDLFRNAVSKTLSQYPGEFFLLGSPNGALSFGGSAEQILDLLDRWYHAYINRGSGSHLWRWITEIYRYRTQTEKNQALRNVQVRKEIRAKEHEKRNANTAKSRKRKPKSRILRGGRY